MTTPIITTPLPFVFANGTTADATQVDTDLNTIVNSVNAFETNGSWTPADASGASLVFANISAGYTRHGNMMFAYMQLTYPVTVNGNNALISGLPVNLPNPTYSKQGVVSFSNNPNAFACYVQPVVNSNTFGITGSTNTPLTNAALSGATINILLIYPVT